MGNSESQEHAAGGLSAEDAESFASRIKPAWETDWEAPPSESDPATARLESNPPAPTAEAKPVVVPPVSAPHIPTPAPPPDPEPAPADEVPAAAAPAPEGPMAGSVPSRKTVTGGTPLSAGAASEAKAAPPAPEPLSATTPSAKPFEPPPPPVLAPEAGEPMSSSDTIIEGVPTVDIGTTPPEPPRPKPAPEQAPPASASKEAELAPRAPLRPGKTKLGIGTDPGEAPASAKPSERKSSPGKTPAPGRTGDRDAPTPSSRRSSKPGKAPAPLNGSMGARSSREGRASSASATPDYGAERSESVEIPVAKSPVGTILKVLGVAAVLGGVVVGIRMMGKDDSAPSAPPRAETAAPTATAAPAPTPVETATQAPAPPPEPPPTAAPPPTAEPKPAATPPSPPTPATPTPVGKKPPATQLPPPAKPPEKPTGKKPGGLIRETPF